ncbi:MAG: aminotransferase class V-fold PLP-dependent enzyme [Vicinamibacterales bacterium]
MSTSSTRDVDLALTGMNRRNFLRRLTGNVALAAAMAEMAGVRARASMLSLEQAAGAAGSEADFWAKVRGEFLLDPHVAYLNNGTLGPTPRPVLYTLIERYQKMATDTGAENTRESQEAEEVRKKAAAFIGAGVDEIALMHNTTEGMSFIASGLDLKAGDEILMTFHEHPGGRQPWVLKARRHGVVIKEVTFPLPLKDPATVLNLFNDAITPRTRVISVSHTTYQTGTMMPAKQICALARSKGILSLVDAAHPLGQMQIDMKDIGADYYAMSPHKWLDAPTGTGLLYMRRESQDRVWPTMGTTGWDDPKRGAARFDRHSQRAWPLVLAFGSAMDFQITIGKDRIERRVRMLHARLREKVAALPGVTIYTSPHAELSCALLGFSLPNLKNQDIVDTLLARHGTYVRTIQYDLNAVRVSTHHYNTEQQVDRLIEGLHDILKNGVMPPKPTTSASRAGYEEEEYTG